MSDFMERWVRTYVPGAVAWAIGTFGLPESLSDDLTVGLTALVFAVYYGVFHFLEEKVNPLFGWFLGRPKGLWIPNVEDRA